jgi:DNA repair protein RecO (recombination protein O)
MNRHLAQPAYVLHQWDWSETSLIVDLFTRDQGRVAVVAKGAKRPYSQLRAVLLPFQRVLVSVVRPRGSEAAEILTLRSAEFAGADWRLPAERLMAGFYLNELLIKLLARQDAHERLFDAYADTLRVLALPQECQAGTDEAALRAFELVLLRETGVLPDLARSGVTQAPVVGSRTYVLRAEVGLVAGGDGAPGLTGAQCLTLQAALEQRSMAELRTASAAALPALKHQLREALAYHLGSLPLRTRQTVRALHRLLDPGPPSSAP